MKEKILEMEPYSLEHNVQIIEKESIAFIMKFIKTNNIKEILDVVFPICSDEAVIVFEMAIDSPYVEYKGLELWKNKEYGNKRVVIYRR
mgnify:CR=1 FL=1